MLSSGPRRRPRRGPVKSTLAHSPTGVASSAARPEWLTIEEFCEELGVPLSTAYKWRMAGPESGRFPRYVRLPNGKIRIRWDWYREWVDGLATG